MAKLTRIALDLTLLIDLARNDSVVLLGLKAARTALGDVDYVVSPATAHALTHAHITPVYDAETRELAGTALNRLTRQWDFTYADMAGADLGVCLENAKQLITDGLLGGNAWHAAHTITEAACLECSILLCLDEELLNVDYARLNKALDKLDRGSLWITTPGEILRQASLSPAKD